MKAKPVKTQKTKSTAPATGKAKSGKIAKATSSGEKTIYSEKDLAEFRKLILDKMEEAKTDHALLKITLSHTEDNGTDDTSHTFNSMEGSADSETKEETAQLALRQEKYIKNLQNALVRIENKTYGICRITGNLIPKKRLLSVPHATLSMEAKQAQKFNQD